MRGILFFLITITISFSIFIGPRILEQKDLGNVGSKEFTYSLLVDCDSATIDVLVMDDNLSPINLVQNYLSYIDYSRPLLSKTLSDESGHTIHKLPGDVKYMRGMFVLLLQKQNFRSKEIHFDIIECLGPLPKPTQTQLIIETNTSEKTSIENYNNDSSNITSIVDKKIDKFYPILLRILKYYLPIIFGKLI